MMGSWEFLQYQPNYFQNKGCKSEMVMELVMEVRRDLKYPFAKVVPVLVRNHQHKREFSNAIQNL